MEVITVMMIVIMKMIECYDCDYDDIDCNHDR